MIQPTVERINGTALTQRNGMLHSEECARRGLPVRDTLEVLSGKWKLPILATLMHGKRRFKELERDIPRITPKMLSKELKELEMHDLVARFVHEDAVMVEYELTPYGQTLDKVLTALMEWGQTHRKRMMGK
jgi:DNA-binding HxlR family transcriptional regulator